MKHKDKLKMARRLVGRAKNVFNSKFSFFPNITIKERAKRNEAKKFKILDDKGKEHKVGEIFESKDLTINL